MLELQIIGRTDLGRQRALNEDGFAYSADPDRATWSTQESGSALTVRGATAAVILADGMGGAEAGEVASALAIASMQDFLTRFPKDRPGDDDEIIIRMRQGFLLAHDRIVHDALARPERKGMGTTLITGMILNDQVYVMWSGDSRAYRYHPLTGQRDGKGEGHLQMISSDHSMVWEMVLQGELTPEEARVHPYSNVITQSLGDLKHKPRPDYRVAPLFRDDILLFCSDGLNGMLSDTAIREILERPLPLEALADELVAAANQAGGNDNITLVLVKVMEGPERIALEDAPDSEARATAGGQVFMRKMTRQEPEVPAGKEPVSPPPHEGRIAPVQSVVSGEPVYAAPAPRRRPSRGAWWLLSLLILGLVGWFIYRSWSPPAQSLEARIARLQEPLRVEEMGEMRAVRLDSLLAAYRAGALSQPEMERLVEEYERLLRMPSATGTLGREIPADSGEVDSGPPAPAVAGEKSGFWPPRFRKLLQEVEAEIRLAEKRTDAPGIPELLGELKQLQARINGLFTPDGNVTIAYKKAEKEFQAGHADLRRIRDRIRAGRSQGALPAAPQPERGAVPGDTLPPAGSDTIHQQETPTPSDEKNPPDDEQ